jgi:GT2 family glycosyltransferase/2-polyprenyl-3-methyl-5-hydroxy-6-metoxy-1,4-benzoquinol methylase
MAHEERVVPALHDRQFFFQEHLARYQFAASLVAGRSVLDCACGTGYGSELLARAGASRVCAVDLSAEALSYSVAHHAHPAVRRVRADAHVLPFAPASFDVAVSFETLEHLPRPRELLRGLRDVLVPGGVLLVSAPNALVEDTANPFHVHNWSPAQLSELLREFFPVVRLVPQYTVAGSVLAAAPLTTPSVVTHLPAAPAVEEAPYVLAVCSTAAVPLPALAYSGGSRVELAWLEPLRRHVQNLEGGVAERDATLARLRGDLADAQRAREELARARELLSAAEGEAARAREDLSRVGEESRRAGLDRDRFQSELAEVRRKLGEIERGRAFRAVARYWGTKARARALGGEVRLAGERLVLAARRRAADALRRPAAPRGSPLVSVVVPVYDNAAYLQPMIESVLSQTYRHLELVLWDDASPDPAVAPILERAARADPRVKHLRGARNLGISGATNEAIAHATGEWIAFLDCDDQLAPEALERVVQHARAHPDVRFVYTNRVDVDEAGNPVRAWDFTNRTFAPPAEELLKGMFVSHLKVAHREALREAGLLRARYDLSQDYDHVLRLSEVARFGFVGEPVYRHRVHARQSTQEHLALQERRAAQAREAALLRRDVEAGRFDRPVSIIVLSLNRLADTVRCIDALDRHTHVAFELVVLDNGSDPDVRDALRARLGARARTKLVLSDVNLGCAGGRREALRHATGELVVTLDNDIEVTRGWLGQLLTRLLESPDHAGACCRVVFPDGTLQFTGGTAERDGDFVRFGLIARGTRIEDLASLRELECDWIPGGATVFRREVYDGVELSTELEGAYEDNHFSLAVRRAGWKLVNAPLATVWHHHVAHNAAAAKDARYMAARYDVARLRRSLVAFYRLNGLVLEDRDLWRLLELPEDREAVRRIVVAEADAAARAGRALRR